MGALLERSLKKPTGIDIFWMTIFVVFITYQPFFMHHEIIMMETGIHLPALNALFHGLVPYRDFLFLRGPMELYVPAAMMKLFGMNSALLPVFYYAGTMATLILCIFLAGKLFQSRLIFYAMVPAFIARTFPRISYYYWGGMRYAMGFAVLLLLFYFFKTQQRRWIFLAGIVCALAALTTSEAGVSVLIAVVSAFVFAWCLKTFDRIHLWRCFGIFWLGFFAVAAFYTAYLVSTDSLKGFIESNYVVAVFNGKAYPGAPGVKPETTIQFIISCIPGTKFFKYMSVAWCYLFFAALLFYKARQKKIEWVHAFLVGLSFYGIVLYAAAFRKIEGHHFEMALQVEKFIYFFLVEHAILYLWQQKTIKMRQWIVVAIAGGVFLSSIVYAIDRFDHRFVMFKLIEKKVFHNKKVHGLSLLEKQESAELHIERANGNTVPLWQEKEITGVVDFLMTHTQPNEAVFCFPEVGNFNFWADRPFIGRFPITTFSWMYEPWYQELWADLNKEQPRYIVMTHLGHRTFPELWYFRNPRNRERFEQMSQFILKNYKPVQSFESVEILQHR